MGRSRAVASETPFADRTCDVVCLAFGLWTLCCHTIVFLGGSLQALIALFGLASAAWVWASIRQRRPASASGPGAAQVDFATGSNRRPALWGVQGAGLALGAAGAVFFASDDSAVVFWWWLVLLLGAAAAFFVVAERPWSEPPQAGRALEIGLWTVGLVCALLTLASHRFDIDDAFYVNLAVAAADHPTEALLARDTMHGIPGLTLLDPVYRVHSYELWNGMLAYLTGIPSIYWFHWVSASAAAFLVALAHARLLRLLMPRLWPWAVVTVLFVILAVGETHRWYGNFAFVRLWQGKSIYLFVFAPLVTAYAIEFARRPGRRGWLLLASAQIASLGLTSSSIWVAPAGALLALAAVVRPTRRGLQVFTVGALASVYVLGAGYGVKVALREDTEMRRSQFQGEARKEADERRDQILDERHEPGAELGLGLAQVLGRERMRVAGVAAILMAWACCARGLAQRLAIVIPLGLAIVVLNPYASRWVAEHLTGTSFWRALWAIPVPLLVTFVLLAPLQLPGRRWRQLGAPAAWAGLLVAFATLVPQYGSLSAENGTLLSLPPRLKVHDLGYRWARALNESVPAGSHVVAPAYVSAWLPTFHHHVHPLTVRWMYLRRNQSQLGSQHIRNRFSMTAFSGGELYRKNAPEVFRRGIEVYDVKAVCLRNSAISEQIRAILRRAGFERKLHGLDHEIWVRS